MVQEYYPLGTVGIMLIDSEGARYFKGVDIGDHFSAFFNTVSKRLEGEQWGSRFPILMKDLYEGKDAGVVLEKATAFRSEIETIQKEFTVLPASEIVAEGEDNAVNNYPDIKTADEFFKKIFSTLIETLGDLERAGGKIVIASAREVE